MEILFYLGLRAFAAVLAGLLGMGGGLVIVRVLVLLLPRQGIAGKVTAHLAVGTSLATIVFTSIPSVPAHHRHSGCTARCCGS